MEAGRRAQNVGRTRHGRMGGRRAEEEGVGHGEAKDNEINNLLKMRGEQPLIPGQQ